MKQDKIINREGNYMKKITDKTKFIPIETKRYKRNGWFEAGLVKNSPHKADRIYLRINDYFFHLRDDEAFAIINTLSNALWCEWIFRKYGHCDKKKLPKWKTLKQITN